MHHEIKMRDYFCNDLIYNDVLFRTRFKMSKRLFSKEIEVVCAYVSYIIESLNATYALRFVEYT